MLGVPEMYTENDSQNSMNSPLLLNGMNKQSLLFVQLSFHQMVFSKELSATRMGKQLKIVPFTMDGVMPCGKSVISCDTQHEAPESYRTSKVFPNNKPGKVGDG
jgi:hypothetical protein